MTKLGTPHYVTLASFGIALLCFILLATSYVMDNKGIQEPLLVTFVFSVGIFCCFGFVIILDWLSTTTVGKAINDFRGVVGGFLKLFFSLVFVIALIAGVIFVIVNFPLQTIAVVLILFLIAR